MGTRAAGSVGTAAISTLAYNGLVEVVDGEVVPQLALSWEQPEPTRYVFDLRTDVEFHDGTPFDAAAVKANFDRLMAPGSDAVKPAAVPGVGDGARRPPGRVPAGPAGRRVPRVAAPRPGDDDVAHGRRAVRADRPVQGLRRHRALPVQRVPAGRPDRARAVRRLLAGTNHLDAITFTIIPTTSTQIQAFLNGEFDLIGVVPAQVGQVTRDPSVVIHEFVGNTFNYLTFNQARAPFDNPDVRRAFSAALDREGIAQGVYNGYAEPASGPFSPAIGDAYQDLSDVVAQSYAPDEARRWLQQSGFDTGATVRFDSFTQAPWGSEADAMTAQLQEIGLDIKLEKQDFGSWADLIYTAKDFTMFNSGQTTRTVDPDEVLYRWRTPAATSTCSASPTPSWTRCWTRPAPRATPASGPRCTTTSPATSPRTRTPRSPCGEGDHRGQPERQGPHVLRRRHPLDGGVLALQLTARRPARTAGRVALSLLQALVVAVGATSAVFLLMRLIPGDPARILAGPGGNVTDEQIELTRRELGLDDPLPVQYWDWISAAFRGDFGTSLVLGERVSDLLGDGWW